MQVPLNHGEHGEQKPELFTAVATEIVERRKKSVEENDGETRCHLDLICSVSLPSVYFSVLSAVNGSGFCSPCPPCSPWFNGFNGKRVRSGELLLAKTPPLAWVGCLRNSGTARLS